MATEYVTRAWWPQGEWRYDDPKTPPSLSVSEPERAPRKTGLLDASGTPIYAVEHPAPIGFVRFD